MVDYKDYNKAAELILLNVSKFNPSIEQKLEMAKVYAILALAEAINNKNK
mgnify:FL=1